MTMNQEAKGLRMRLRRIAGQIGAIERMIEAERPGSDVMHQLAAAQAALGKVGKVVFRSYVEISMRDAVRSGDERERERKLDEVMAVFDRYGQVRER
jgi:DNA-binding FrmR family transcriptional regulator